MAGNDPVDQDAIAAQWEASLDSEDPAQAAEAAAANELSGTMALQWAAMVEDGGRDFGTGKNNGERVLSQEEIDNLLGFSVGATTALTRRVSSSFSRNSPAEPLRSIGRSSRI